MHKRLYILFQIGLTILALVVSSFCQYAVETGLRPDIAFGDYNDRFDLTDVINYQQKHYKDYGLAKEDERAEEFRRHNHERRKSNKKDKKRQKKVNKNHETRKNAKKLARMVSKAREDHVNQLANEILLSMVPKRRFLGEFAYHDNMNEGGGDEYDFAENLKRFEGKSDNDIKGDTLRRMEGLIYKLHGRNNARRVLDPQKELLFHYAAPIDMKIKGYLQVPLQ